MSDHARRYDRDDDRRDDRRSHERRYDERHGAPSSYDRGRDRSRSPVRDHYYAPPSSSQAPGPQVAEPRQREAPRDVLPDRLPPGMNPDTGDWPCLSCGNWNFARRWVCNRCNAERRRTAAPLSSYAPPSYGGRGGVPVPSEDFGYIVPKDVPLPPGAEGRTYAIQAQAGWERRPKGTAGANEKRTGNAGGFMEFDREEEDDRRKRRAIEEKIQAQVRKTSKSKCAFCHRASCIC